MDTRQLKSAAIAAIKARLKPAIACSAVYLALYTLMNYLILRLYRYDEYVEQVYDLVRRGDTTTIPALPEITPAAGALICAIYVMLIILLTGYMGTALRMARGEDFKLRDLLNGFDFPLKAVCIFVVRGFAVMLGLMLFVVPGVILFCRYSQAIYLLFENPDKSALWCLRESGRLMQGHKMPLFLLYCSFLPVLIVSELVALLLGVPLLDLVLNPYLFTAVALFHVVRFAPADTAGAEDAPSGD